MKLKYTKEELFGKCFVGCQFHPKEWHLPASLIVDMLYRVLTNRQVRTEYRFSPDWFAGGNIIELTYVYENARCPHCSKPLP